MKVEMLDKGGVTSYDTRFGKGPTCGAGNGRTLRQGSAGWKTNTLTSRFFSDFIDKFGNGCWQW